MSKGIKVIKPKFALGDVVKTRYNLRVAEGNTLFEIKRGVEFIIEDYKICNFSMSRYSRDDDDLAGYENKFFEFSCKLRSEPSLQFNIEGGYLKRVKPEKGDKKSSKTTLYGNVNFENNREYEPLGTYKK